VIRTGPGAPPGFGLQPLGTARPKPAISFRSPRGIARQAISTTKNHSNFAAARLNSSTQGAGVLLSYCLSSPVQSAVTNKVSGLVLRNSKLPIFLPKLPAKM